MRSQSNYTTYKAFTFLSMLYITIILLANILIFRMTSIGSITISAGAYLIPIWFVLADIIAEVYGYSTCKKMLWSCLYCNLIFGILCSASIFLPIAPDWHYAPAYY